MIEPSNVLPFEKRPEKPVKADTDHGYTTIAHQIMEAIMACELSARHIRVVLAVARQTYGYHKKTDYLTGSRIGSLIGIEEANARRILKDLVDRKILLKNGKMVGINTHLEDWNTAKTCQKRHGNKPSKRVRNDTENVSKTTRNNESEPCQKRHASVSETTRKTCQKRHTQKIKDNNLKDNNTSENKKPLTEDDHEDLRLAKWMHERISDVLPYFGAKRINYSKWANTIRLMRQRDGIDRRTIAVVFKFANEHSFWSSVIQSPENLRKQFPKLCKQAQEQTNGNSQSSNAADRSYQAAERVYREAEAQERREQGAQFDVAESDGEILDQNGEPVW